MQCHATEVSKASEQQPHISSPVRVLHDASPRHNECYDSRTSESDACVIKHDSLEVNILYTQLSTEDTSA
jgi:hypothetical protein